MKSCRFRGRTWQSWLMRPGWALAHLQWLEVAFASAVKAITFDQSTKKTCVSGLWRRLLFFFHTKITNVNNVYRYRIQNRVDAISNSKQSCFRWLVKQTLKLQNPWTLIAENRDLISGTNGLIVWLAWQSNHSSELLSYKRIDGFEGRRFACFTKKKLAGIGSMASVCALAYLNVLVDKNARNPRRALWCGS